MMGMFCCQHAEKLFRLCLRLEKIHLTMVRNRTILRRYDFVPKGDGCMQEPTQTLQRYTYLQNEIDEVYHDISLKMGLTDSALMILYTLCSHENSCPLQTICRSTGLSKQTINSALRKLEGENIVFLSSDGARSKRVSLTDAGQALASRTACRLLAAENEIFDSWQPEEREQYIVLTEKYLLALREKLKNNF